MALDLEEQEQIDRLKQFWREWGNLISWIAVGLLLLYAAWNGWGWWQQRQAAQATALYDEVERIAAGGDAEKIDRALSDMKDKFGGTLQAQHAALLAAASHGNAGRQDQARAALQWAADHGPDEGVRAIARLRLAGLLLDAKAYDEALKELAVKLPAEFAPLAADRRGDVYLAQGKKAEAVAEYLQAWRGLDINNSYHQLVDAKLAALGVNPGANPGIQAEAAK